MARSNRFSFNLQLGDLRQKASFMGQTRMMARNGKWLPPRREGWLRWRRHKLNGELVLSIQVFAREKRPYTFQHRGVILRLWRAMKGKIIRPGITCQSLREVPGGNKMIAQTLPFTLWMVRLSSERIGMRTPPRQASVFRAHHQASAVSPTPSHPATRP